MRCPYQPVLLLWCRVRPPGITGAMRYFLTQWWHMFFINSTNFYVLPAEAGNQYGFSTIFVTWASCPCGRHAKLQPILVYPLTALLYRQDADVTRARLIGRHDDILGRNHWGFDLLNCLQSHACEDISVGDGLRPARWSILDRPLRYIK